MNNKIIVRVQKPDFDLNLEMEALKLKTKKAKSKIIIILSAIGSKTLPILLSVLNFLAK